MYDLDLKCHINAETYLKQYLFIIMYHLSRAQHGYESFF